MMDEMGNIIRLLRWLNFYRDSKTISALREKWAIFQIAHYEKVISGSYFALHNCRKNAQIPTRPIFLLLHKQYQNLSLEHDRSLRHKAVTSEREIWRIPNIKENASIHKMNCYMKSKYFLFFCNLYRDFTCTTISYFSRQSCRGWFYTNVRSIACNYIYI